ncbi:serine hydrolase [Lachnospiraceae bacterium 62-35]
MKRLLTWILCFTISINFSLIEAIAAPDWPSNVSIEADGGIVIDADTATVLYGKNIHHQYYPASITKVLTALIVLERCKLNEEVTFSHDAVYNVESGSSNANIEEGDVLTVEDCLYALLLNSANEAANALAEHISGSREAFAELMNEWAAGLGCLDSHFANPSGLNDKNHYTSAYDMALICQAALKNETFLKINSALYYELRPTKRDPEGHTLYAHHAMLKKNNPNYYPGILGGKTGYTTLAGNTLVTFAERDGMTLIAVILNGHRTHYQDTKKLLDFGFNRFHNLNVSDNDTTYSSVENDMLIAGLPAGDLSRIVLERGSSITLPKEADFFDSQVALEYELDHNAPKNAIAKLNYTYNDRPIGSAYLLNEIIQTPSLPALPMAEAALLETQEKASAASGSNGSDSSPENSLAIDTSLENDKSGQNLSENPSSQRDSSKGDSSEEISPENSSLEGGSSQDSSLENLPSKKGAFPIPGFVWFILAAVFLSAIAIIILFTLRIRHMQRIREQKIRRAKRMRRLKEMGISSEEFKQLMHSKRTFLEETKHDD